MINTIAEGHNSGRTYYLQASSKEHCLQLVKFIQSLSKRARERAEARTRFAKLQLRLRKVFDSHFFQSTSATLIIAVSIFPFFPFVMMQNPNKLFWCRVLYVVLKIFHHIPEFPRQHFRGSVRKQNDPRERIDNTARANDRWAKFGLQYCFHSWAAGQHMGSLAYGFHFKRLGMSFCVWSVHFAKFLFLCWEITSCRVYYVVWRH